MGKLDTHRMLRNGTFAIGSEDELALLLECSGEVVFCRLTLNVVLLRHDDVR